MPTAPDDIDGLTGEENAYRITSISFIGHSLGGLIQTYAIAYIQKHSPQFFDLIKPINFIALASPFLGLSHENPLYVRFALDLGLVGRTGQDLGLGWTMPRVRSGWEALIGGKGHHSSKHHGKPDPGSKPLLRILPSGPAREVLLKFQHRTVYSNVVNDGIVPLRTSCLLFLDWKGLDRVEKANRGNGLVGTMAEWGWAELTGANSRFPGSVQPSDPVAAQHHPAADNTMPGDSSSQVFKAPQQPDCHSVAVRPKSDRSSSSGALDSLWSILQPKEIKDHHRHKQAKIYKRGQTLNTLGDPVGSLSRNRSQGSTHTHDSSLYDEDGLNAPPKTTIFESAGDLLMPPLPTTEFILDPTARPRTIFHDRIYYPEDIPPPIPSKRRTLSANVSHDNDPSSEPSSGVWNESESGLKVEEKIARAYHRDLPWRKVLVRLEPDAHNNIIVRRPFTNAYGWPVVKHLVDTHFAHSDTAGLPDTQQQSTTDRAPIPDGRGTDYSGDVRGQTPFPAPEILQRSSQSLLGTSERHSLASKSSLSQHGVRGHGFQAAPETHGHMA